MEAIRIKIQTKTNKIFVTEQKKCYLNAATYDVVVTKLNDKYESS